MSHRLGSSRAQCRRLVAGCGRSGRNRAARLERVVASVLLQTVQSRAGGRGAACGGAARRRLEPHQRGSAEAALRRRGSALFDGAERVPILNLTSLTCTGIGQFGISGLLDIASHSTLEEWHIDTAYMAYAEWIDDNMRFPISVEEDEQ